MYTYQFAQYAWTHMILLVVFIPSSFFVSNIFDGLMWFLLPCSLVIINDIGAYLFGMHLQILPQPVFILSLMHALQVKLEQTFLVCFCCALCLCKAAVFVAGCL